MAVSPIVLIAAPRGALIESLLFALELEGLSVRLFHTLADLLADNSAPLANCLVLDHSLLPAARSVADQAALEQLGLPVVVLASHQARVWPEAAQAKWVERIVEKPLLGTSLFDEIREVLNAPKTRLGQAAPNRLAPS